MSGCLGSSAWGSSSPGRWWRRSPRCPFPSQAAEEGREGGEGAGEGAEGGQDDGRLLLFSLGMKMPRAVPRRGRRTGAGGKRRKGGRKSSRSLGDDFFLIQRAAWFDILLTFLSRRCSRCSHPEIWILFLRASGIWRKNSKHLLREGGAIRTRKSGHCSTRPWYLAAVCSVSVSPEEYKNIGCIWMMSSCEFSARF